MPNVVPATTFCRVWHPVLRRSYGQKLEWRAHRERLQSKQQPTVTTADGTKTSRLRPNLGDRQSTLPLPPIMDPIATAARQKDRTPKARSPPEAEIEKSEFSRALAVNPFAQALATSIRHCNLTRARLPSHFLHPCTAHFRVLNEKLKAYIGPTKSLGRLPEDKLVKELGGSPAGSAASKSYVLNSREVIRAAGYKSRNLQMLVSQRIKEAADERAQALGRSRAMSGNWTWLGSEEQTRDILIADIIEAFKRYLEKLPGCQHLISLAKLEKTDYKIIPDLQAQREPSVGSSAPDGGSEQSQLKGDQEVLIPAYDFAQLGVRETLKGLPLDSEFVISSIVGILQSKSTLKLHLSLQRLAMFQGTESARQWIVMRKAELLDSVSSGLISSFHL